MMTKVRVYGNVWDHAGRTVPAVRRPELWFRPNGSNRSFGSQGALLAGIEVQATLNANTGAFEVELDNAPGILYRPILRWLVNPMESLPERLQWGYIEWGLEFNPGPNGGQIGTLLPTDVARQAYYFGPHSEPPPPGFRGYWEVQAEPGREDSDDPFIGDVRRVYGG